MNWIFFIFGFCSGLAFIFLIALWLYLKDPEKPQSARLNIPVEAKEPEDEADWWKRCDE